MYAVHQQSHVSIQLNQLVGVAQAMTPTFFFESSDAATLRIGLGEVDSISVPASVDAYDLVAKWYQGLRTSIPPQVEVAICGGFAFETTQVQGAEAVPGYFFLPKLSLTQLADGTFEVTSLNVSKREAQQELERFLHRINETDKVNSPRPTVLKRVEIDENKWLQGVAQTVDKLKEEPTLKKVVLARRLVVVSGQVLQPEQAWLQSRRVNAETYHILLKTKAGAFISSTPERLLKVIGQSFETASIAGTIARGDDVKTDRQLAETLLHDEKNRQEQRYVTDEIVAVLQRQNAQVAGNLEPHVLKNRRVQHLYTPIKGVLKKGTSVFNLLQQLHPTPALGGVPKKQALAIIRQVEGVPRGFFGAPIGYLNFQHAGEFAVGIRSAALKETTATLFAGAGIVADSVPEAELLETRLKFKPMLQSLFPKEDPHDDQ